MAADTGTLATDTGTLAADTGTLAAGTDSGERPPVMLPHYRSWGCAFCVCFKCISERQHCQAVIYQRWHVAGLSK